MEAEAEMVARMATPTHGEGWNAEGLRTRLDESVAPREHEIGLTRPMSPSTVRCP